MRYLSFDIDGRAAWGVTDGERVHDLSGGAGAATLLDHLRAGGHPPSTQGSPSHALADVVLDLPLRGSRLFCIGLNYKAHVQETARDSAERPSVFTRTWESMSPADAPVWKPTASDHFDFEGELTVVIGKAGRHIREADALDHVFGYSIVNDGSLRDFQKYSVTAGKNFERSGGFGPWIVDADEAPDWDSMTLTTRLNGQQVQHTATNLMIFPVPELIAYISEVTTLLPGDLIATGTPAGVGARRTPPLWMKPGDLIEVEVSGLGILRNPVIAEPS